MMEFTIRPMVDCLTIEEVRKLWKADINFILETRDGESGFNRFPIKRSAIAPDKRICVRFNNGREKVMLQTGEFEEIGEIKASDFDAAEKHRLKAVGEKIGRLTGTDIFSGGKGNATR